MNLKRKRSAVLKLWHGLVALDDVAGTNKFIYAVCKTKSRIWPEIEKLNKAIETPAEGQVYDKARIELCIKHSYKEKNGQPVFDHDPTTGKMNYSMKNPEAFKRELETLKAEHVDAVRDGDERLKNYEVMLEAEIEIQVCELTQADLPDGLTVKQLDGILDLITS